MEPFPTLEQVLKVVDENTGFDIEIKYPQQDVVGILCLISLTW